MARFSLESPEDWREVSSLQFDRFLHRYPHPLQCDPPGDKKARLREYLDLSLGERPGSIVAKMHGAHRCSAQFVRGEYVHYCQE